jgi:exodeoxyribonuclease VII large subunit
MKTGLNELTRRMLDPRRRIQEWWLRIDDFSGRLARLSTVYLRRNRERLTWLLQRFNASSPRIQIQKYKLGLDQIERNLILHINIIAKENRSMLREAISKLQALNPLAILQRGYSVARTLPDRRVIMDPDQANLNQELEVLLSAGILLCEIKGKSRYGEENV